MLHLVYITAKIILVKNLRYNLLASLLLFCTEFLQGFAVLLCGNIGSSYSVHHPVPIADGALQVFIAHFAEVHLGHLNHFCTLGLLVPFFEIDGCVCYLLAVVVPGGTSRLGCFLEFFCICDCILDFCIAMILQIIQDGSGLLFPV